MPRLLPAALLLLVPFIGHAQQPLPDLMADHAYFGPPRYENASDSADFTAFRTGLRTVHPTGGKDTTKVHYRLAWREDEHGGLWRVARGDGSVWEAPVNEVLDPFVASAFVTADGRRGVLLAYEIPCGLICRNAVYYVEE